MQNLRVIKAFILPTMPLANLNAGVLMIGENGADLMLKTPPLPVAFSKSFSHYLFFTREVSSWSIAEKSNVPPLPDSTKS